MSSWDTNPWSNCYDPYLELKYRNKWRPGTLEISTPPEIAQCGTKTTPLFLPADGEASWSLLPSLVSLLSVGTVQPEKTYSYILKVTGDVWESQKRITAITSVHLPKPVSTDVRIKLNSVLINPIGKDGVQSWSM